MTTFVTADLHLGHANILKFEPDARPFECIDTMHDEMVDRWNDTVRRKDDLVYIVGDLLLGSRKFVSVLEKMNGRKVLIGGNHDHLRIEDYAPYFERVLGAKEKWNCIMTHIPVHESQFPRYVANIHGHLHSKFITLPDGNRDPRYINVCMDANDLKPVRMEVIKEKIELARKFQA